MQGNEHAAVNRDFEIPEVLQIVLIVDGFDLDIDKFMFVKDGSDLFGEVEIGNIRTDGLFGNSQRLAVTVNVQLA